MSSKGFTAEQWEPLEAGWLKITPENGAAWFRWSGWDAGRWLPCITVCPNDALGEPFWVVTIETFPQCLELALPAVDPWRRAACAFDSTLRVGERAMLSGAARTALFLASQVTP